MATLYRKSIQQLKVFTRALSPFCDACGGDPRELAFFLHEKYTVDHHSYHDPEELDKVLGYFDKVVIPHKVAVYHSGMELIEKKIVSPHHINIFEDLLWIHDMSKFSADEVIGYSGYKFGGENSDEAKKQFKQAWHHHKMHNPHHPEYWLNPNRSGELQILDMPYIYVAEMVADWMGAGQTYGNSLENWIPDNIHKFRFSSQTMKILIDILDKIGITVERYAKNDFLTMKT